MTPQHRLPPRCPHQSGAALLSAMLTVALVASLASASLWLQWRQTQIEAAERGRSQTQWLMVGALDWTRLILAEDANASAHIDHLGEPWALPVQESKLSAFLSREDGLHASDAEVYLSGHMADAQGRLNVASLLKAGQPVPEAEAAWRRLFVLLNLPAQEANTLVQGWQQAANAAGGAAPGGGNGLRDGQAQGGTAPIGQVGNPSLLPQRVEQLVWLGLSPATVARLGPYVTVLPQPTPVNLNTADALVLEAVLGQMDAASVRTVLTQRSTQPWQSLPDIQTRLGAAARGLDPALHSVNSRYFEVHGRLRVGASVQDEVALVERKDRQARMIWRTRRTGDASLQSRP